MSISRLIPPAAILLALAIGFQASASDEDLLKKRLSIETQTARPVDYIALLLRQSGVWGGIEDYEAGCGQEPEARMPALEGTLDDGLARTHQLVKSLSWRVLDEGILVVKGNPAPSILDTKIDQFSFNPYDSPNKVTNALLANPIVANSIAKRGFSIGSPELGFAQAKPEMEKSVMLKKVTVREVLTSVAKSPNPRVWLLLQRTCDGRKSLVINWLVK